MSSFYLILKHSHEIAKAKQYVLILASNLTMATEIAGTLFENGVQAYAFIQNQEMWEADNNSIRRELIHGCNRVVTEVQYLAELRIQCELDEKREKEAREKAKNAKKRFRRIYSEAYGQRRF